jgi:hypothetical protein
VILIQLGYQIFNFGNCAIKSCIETGLSHPCSAWARSPRGYQSERVKEGSTGVAVQAGSLVLR